MKKNIYKRLYYRYITFPEADEAREMIDKLIADMIDGA